MVCESSAGNLTCIFVVLDCPFAKTPFRSGLIVKMVSVEVDAQSIDKDPSVIAAKRLSQVVVRE